MLRTHASEPRALASGFVKLALAALLLPLAGLAASVSIQLENGAFKVVGWQPPPEPRADWASIFTVSTGPDVPPLFGSYSIENGALTFRPRFPLSSGVTYRAVLHAGESADEFLQVPNGQQRRKTVESVQDSFGHSHHVWKEGLEDGNALIDLFDSCLFQ